MALGAVQQHFHAFHKGIFKRLGVPLVVQGPLKKGALISGRSAACFGPGNSATECAC